MTTLRTCMCCTENHSWSLLDVLCRVHALEQVGHHHAPFIISVHLTCMLGAKTQGGKTKAPLPKNKASLVKNRVCLEFRVQDFGLCRVIGVLGLQGLHLGDGHLGLGFGAWSSRG